MGRVIKTKSFPEGKYYEDNEIIFVSYANNRRAQASGLERYSIANFDRFHPELVKCDALCPPLNMWYAYRDKEISFNQLCEATYQNLCSYDARILYQSLKGKIGCCHEADLYTCHRREVIRYFIERDIPCAEY